MWWWDCCTPSVIHPSSFPVDQSQGGTERHMHRGGERADRCRSEADEGNENVTPSQLWMQPPIPRGALISCSVWYNKVWMMPSARHAKSYTVTVSHLIGLATGCCCCCCLCCCWGNHGHSEKPGDEERRNNKGMSVMLFHTNTDKQRIVCMRLFCNAHALCKTPTQ